MTMKENSVRNIGPQGQRKRFLSGLPPFVLALAVGVVLILTDTSRWWRLLLSVPLWAGTLGFFQALEKT